MTLHLAEISKAVKPGAHGLVLLDQAGWHGSKALKIPENITLFPLYHSVRLETHVGDSQRGETLNLCGEQD